MKNSTFSAFVANSIQKVLQGYTKGIRLIAVLTLLLTLGVGSAWAGDATLSFASTAQRTSYSTTKQVWEQNGITFTNNKASSTTNVGNYSNPVRLYAKSSATIECSLGNITKIVVTCSSSSYATVFKNSVGNEAIVSGSTVTITPTASSDTYSIASFTAQTRVNSLTVTYADAAPSYTITATSNNNSYGTVSVSGTTITATPNAGYRVKSGDAGYTVTSGTAVVTNNGDDTFTVTPSSNCTVRINFEAIPKYTVTLNAAPGTCAASVTEASAGEGVTLPEPTLNNCDDWTFAGWAEASVGTETTTKPTLIAAGTYKPASNITLYAVYQRTEGGGGTSYQFQKVTALSQIKAGGTFIITNGSYYLPNAQASSSGPLKAYMVAVTNGVVTGAVTDAMKWTFSAADANGKITIKSAANSNYYLYTTNSNGGLRVNNTSDTWTFEEYTVSILGFAMKSTSNSRYCAVYTDGSDWRSYTTKNAANYKTNSGRLDLYKYTEISSNTTYYHSTPDCATPTAPSLSVSGVSESSLSFGDVTVNSPQQLTFTLSGSNLTADATLALSGTNAGLFSVSPTSVTPSNGSITDQIITVTYTPDAKASHSAILTISSPGAESIEIQLSGTGVAQMADYTVKHYQQNIDGTYPTTPTATETLSGEVGTEVTPAVKSYTGFAAPSTKTVTIAADGSTVVEYKYERNSYTLTWDVNEGNDLTGEYTSGSVKYGATITKPADPTRAGYNFSGWHNGTAIVDPATTMPANDLIYTAQWKETYTVTFLNHGEEVEKVTVEAGNSVTLPTEELTSCDAENYPDFFGWTETPIAGVGTEEPTDLITADFTPERSMTLHAVFVDQLPQAGGWQVVSSADELVAGKIYTIGSYGSPTTGTAMGTQNTNNRGTTSWTTGTPVELTLGGTTGAWTLHDAAYNDGAGGYLYAASSSSNHLKTQTTLNDNGKWAITFNSNKAKIVAQGNNERNIIRYNSDNQIFSCYASGQKDIQLLTKAIGKEPTAFITSCCETEAPTDGSIDGVKGSGNAMSVTLYWKDAKDYKRYHVVCDELEIDEHVENTNFQTKEVLSECTTYTFKVSSAPKEGCESPVLEIEATPFIPKTIAFEDGDNTTKQSTTCDSQSITVPTPTAQNCSTYVWKDEATGTEYTDGQTITPANDMTIVAKWSVETYTITFNDWDDTQLQQSTVECGQTPAYNGEIPTRPESNTHQYTFAGWTPIIVPADSDATYTATYTEMQHQITVTWMVNGEEYTEGEPSNMVLAGEKVAKLPTPPSPDDYCGQVFAGWTDEPIDEVNDNIPSILFTTPDASPTIYKEDDNATITFYAVFANIVE